MAPALVHAPIVSTSVYNTFTTPAGIRKELSEQVYYDPNNVTDELVEHYFDASHQYGSQYAPLCALTGEFDIDLISSLKQLHQKSIRFIWGREAKRSPLSLAKDIVAAAQSATLSVIDHAADLPHDEQGEEFNKLIVE
jgi:pimeloyl-ACP methyl ester carboxylesterase